MSTNCDKITESIGTELLKGDYGYIEHISLVD